MKKILVAYYSRTGNTKKVAEKIAHHLKADLDEIIDLKDRKRKIIGWLIAGRDASKKMDTPIKFIKDTKTYNLVVVGTPIWAWTLTPAIRAYLKQNKKIKKIAFFCTCGGNPGNAFEEMEKLSKRPLSTINIPEKEIYSADRKIKEFCENLK
jgi:flavodoxin